MSLQKSKNKIYDLTSQNEKKIIQILHLSDIHIRLQQYHEPYKLVFSELYKKIDELQLQNCVIVITGDLLHSKNQLSPECINLTLDFLQNLANLLPTFLIAGNHDALLENTSRLDSISSILYKRDISNLFYLKDSGVYRYHNIDFYLESLLDDDHNIYSNSKYLKDSNSKKNVKIGLYHGSIAGWRNNIGYVSTTGEKSKTDFEKMDYVLLGDIHKYQFMEDNMAYPGSLISQNHGESDDWHGFLLWNVENGKTHYYKIKNDYRFIDLIYQIETEVFFLDEERCTLCDLEIPSFANCRLFMNGNDLEKKLMMNQLKNKFPKAKFQLNTSRVYDNGLVTTNHMQDVIENEKENAITFIKNYCQDEEMALKIVHSIMPKWQEICTRQGNIHWELISLEFSNMFSYGKGNKYNFSSENNITGIFGPNASGKSSFADIITYLLSSKITRYTHGNSVPKEIINHNKEKADGSICFKISSNVYIIRKNFTRTKNGKIKSVQKFYMIPNCSKDLNNISISNLLKEENCQELTGEQRKRTDEEIEKIIGNFSYFTYINFFFQQNEESFRFFTPAKKKKFLIDLFGYGWIEELEKKYKEQLKTLQIEMKALQNKIGNYTLDKFDNEIETIEKSIKNCLESIQKKEKDIDYYENNIKQLYGYLQNPVDELKNDNVLKNNKQKWEKKLEEKNSEFEKTKQKMEMLESDLEKYKNSKVDSIDLTISEDVNDFYKNISPFFQESETNFWEYKNKFHFEKKNILETINTSLTKIQQDIEMALGDVTNQKITTIISGIKTVPEVDEKIKEKTEQLERIKKNLSIVKKKSFSIEDWREPLQNYHEKTKELLLLEHGFNTSKKQLDDCNTIDFNLSCDSCISNPYYLNKVKIQKEHEKNGKNLKNKQAEVEKVQEFFTNTLSCRKSAKEVQDIYEEQIKNQQNRLKYQDDEKKISETLVKLENTKIYIMNKKANENLKILKKKKEKLEQEKTNYILYLEVKDVMKKVDREWSILGKFDLKQRKILFESERGYETMLKEKENALKEVKELYYEKKEQKEALHKEYNKEMEKMEKDLRYYKDIVCKEEEIVKNKKSLENKRIENTNFQAELVRKKTTRDLWNDTIEEWKIKEKEFSFLQKLCEILDKDALPCHLLASKFPILEEQINDIIQLFLNGKVRFRLEDKLVDVGVETTQGTSSFLSGMESFIVDLAIKLCFSKFSVLPRSNFFLIDEHVSVLDKERLSSVSDLLDLLSSITTNVLLISHIPQIQDFVSKSVNIIKDKEGNRLV